MWHFYHHPGIIWYQINNRMLCATTHNFLGVYNFDFLSNQFSGNLRICRLPIFFSRVISAPTLSILVYATFSMAEIAESPYLSHFLSVSLKWSPKRIETPFWRYHPLFFVSYSIHSPAACKVEIFLWMMRNGKASVSASSCELMPGLERIRERIRKQSARFLLSRRAFFSFWCAYIRHSGRIYASSSKFS